MSRQRHRDLGRRRAEPLADGDQLDVEGEAAVRSGSAAARASGPEKNLNPHWVSVAPARSCGPGRGTRPRRPAGRAVRSSTTEPFTARDPMTTGWPGGEQADRRRPGRTGRWPCPRRRSRRTAPGWPAAPPHRTALAGRSQRSSRTGTGPCRPVPDHVGGGVGARAVHHQDGRGQRKLGGLPAQRGQPRREPAGLVMGRDDDLDRHRAGRATPPGGMSPRPAGQRLPYW